VSILPAQHPAGKPPRGAPSAGSLCTGYGGLDLAVMAVTGARLAWVAETDQYAADLRRLGQGCRRAAGGPPAGSS
jgi:hypothetical protein